MLNISMCINRRFLYLGHSFRGPDTKDSIVFGSALLRVPQCLKVPLLAKSHVSFDSIKIGRAHPADTQHISWGFHGISNATA